LEELPAEEKGRAGKRERAGQARRDGLEDLTDPNGPKRVDAG